jgi:DNA-binding response OmpR family regulator
MGKNRTSQPGDQASGQAPCGTNAPHRILVVDGDTAIRQLSTVVLIRSGYEVDTAADGVAAWQALNHDTYDLLITDHNLPELTGVGLLKKLRAARLDLPVIMATETLPKEEFNRYPWLQPAATLPKPYTVAELVGTVKEVLRASEGDREQIGPPPNWRSQPRRLWV